MPQGKKMNQSAKPVARFALIGGSVATVVAVGAVIIVTKVNHNVNPTSQKTDGSITTSVKTATPPGATQTTSSSGTTTRSQSPNPAISAGSTVPSNFSPSSVSFISSSQGFVLGGVPCGSTSQYCAQLAITTDGGQTFSSTAIPGVTIIQSSAPPSGGFPAGSASEVRFATASVGYIYGPGIWVTTDGGASFSQVSLPGTTGVGTAVAVRDVTITTSTVSLLISPVTSTNQNNTSQIFTANLASPSQFSQQTAPAVLSSTEGLTGNTFGSVLNNPLASSSAMLFKPATSSTWQGLTPPCLSSPNSMGTPSISDAGLFSTGGSNPGEGIVAACNLGVAAGNSSKELDVSTNSGSSWTATNSLPNPGILTSVAASTPSNVSVAAVSGVSLIYSTTNGGATWTTYTFPGAELAQDGMPINDLTYSSSSQIFAILGSVGDVNPGNTQSSLFASSNGGATWTLVTL